MGNISTTKGLNIPFKNWADESICKDKYTKTVCIDLSSYTYLHLKLLKNMGDNILKGEKLAQDLHEKERFFVSPTSGKIIEIQKGHRKRITSVIIRVNTELGVNKNVLSKDVSKEDLLGCLQERGLCFCIHKRPFNRIIGKDDLPRSIFISTITSAPYTPSNRHIFQENKELFDAALTFLKKIAPTHVVYNEEIFVTDNKAIMHKATGPHPIESPSVHLAAFDPITSKDDVVWTLDVYDTLSIGSFLIHGVPFSERIIALAGEGFLDKERVLIKTEVGACIEEIVDIDIDYISGGPLTGASGREYLRCKDLVITSFIPPKKGQILPFIKPGFNKPTVTRAYLGGLFTKRKSFNPSYTLGGERRPFIVKDIYQKHFPLHIYIEPLIKALLAKDYPLAISLGFLEIDTNDLAICEYICPSKISLMSIFDNAKEDYLTHIMN